MKLKQLWNEWKYAFYIMTHPFDGFWDLKHEKRGSMRGAHLHVILMVIVLVCKRQLTAFLFNENDLLNFNPFAAIGNAFLPFIMWVVANWCFTTLMDGEGTLKDVYIASAYALLPFYLINVVGIVLSYALTLETGAFYTLIQAVAVIYLGAMLFFGQLVTHQYSFGKGILTAILTVAGIAVMIYLGLLFCRVVTNIATFIASLIYEARIRFV